MKLDRSYQNAILQRLSDEYPTYDNVREFVEQLASQDIDKYLANITYLQEHELVSDAIECRVSCDGIMSFGLQPHPRITKKGLDFLMDDGGLSATLDVKTIKIHPDSIKALLIDRITNSPSAQKDKSALIEYIKSIPASAAQRLLEKLLDKGLDRAIQTGIDLLM